MTRAELNCSALSSVLTWVTMVTLDKFAVAAGRQLQLDCQKRNCGVFGVFHKIMEAVQRNVLDHTVNICSMLNNLDVKQLVRETLMKVPCKNKVKDLVDHTSPLKFTFRKDKETEKVWPLENEVVWDIVISVISELKLQQHVKNLDNLFCIAAAAVYCASCELRNRKMVDLVFSASNYRHTYNQLMDYISKHITPNAELVERWKNSKACTTT
ncbi:uncharacterized protein EDB93DRAFT_1108616 [Suillus bovinus]|uniref:uncharacterized protein n=1 Tax=Suillus bovinus TaxID=48563 RepID=UPI001B860FD6|nr:uncharacterized protein EDB93DRAFT_1108616 [Suillus bovinus]KAG2129690.1 hypothetical protein EDB93DRAFT_1108616 [Suillus bovinus]